MLVKVWSDLNRGWLTLLWVVVTLKSYMVANNGSTPGERLGLGLGLELWVNVGGPLFRGKPTLALGVIPPTVHCALRGRGVELEV